MLKDDPIIQVRNHTWQRLQNHMWKAFYDEFHGNYDAYMSEMEAADNSGPGVLEMNPGCEAEYTKHEIHMQPGGYTGDTGFPDGYFDVVTSYILHHEVTEQATYDIIQEAGRLLRPGGVYYPVDFYTNPSRKANDPRAWQRIRDWMTYRWNHERWLYEYQQADFEGEIRRAGMLLNRDNPKDTMSYPFGRQRVRNIMGIKSA